MFLWKFFATRPPPQEISRSAPAVTPSNGIFTANFELQNLVARYANRLAFRQKLLIMKLTWNFPTIFAHIFLVIFGPSFRLKKFCFALVFFKPGLGLLEAILSIL